VTAGRSSDAAYRRGAGGFRLPDRTIEEWEPPAPAAWAGRTAGAESLGKFPAVPATYEDARDAGAMERRRAVARVAHYRIDDLRSVRGVSGRKGIGVAVALAALPAVAAAASLLGNHWHAGADQALELLRVGDVGGRHTPLVGAWSRFGWAHPGPLLFWLLAPFFWVFGATGVLVGTGLLNALAAGGAVLVGYRRGGVHLALLIALLEALLAHAFGLGLLVDPWNPWPAFLPFVLFLLLVWCVLCDDFVMLPVAVAVGSFSLQTHAGYLPLVGGLLVIATGWTAWGAIRARGDPVSSATVETAPDRAASPSSPGAPPAPRAMRALAVSAIVALVVWSAPLVQQVSSDAGNLGNLLSYARSPSEPSVGWAAAFGVMGTQLRFPGPWITGHDADPYGIAMTGSTIPALVLIAVLVACIWWGRRRGSHDGARLAVVALLVLGLGVVATARATPVSFFPYVLRWWWAIPAIAALAVAWTAMTTCPARLRTPATAAVLLGLVVTVAVDLAGLPAPVPDAGLSRGMAALAEPTADALARNRRYLVRGQDERNVLAATSALYVELDGRGFNVFVEPHQDAETQYGSWRLAQPDTVDDVVTIVNLAELGTAWEPPSGSRRVALWDPLTLAQRARARELEARIRAEMGDSAPDAPLPSVPVLRPFARVLLGFQLGHVLLDTSFSRAVALAKGARRDDVNELHDLQQLGDGYAVYVSPTR
jgi:hypothetical protein